MVRETAAHRIDPVDAHPRRTSRQNAERRSKDKLFANCERDRGEARIRSDDGTCRGRRRLRANRTESCYEERRCENRGGTRGKEPSAKHGR